MAFLRLLHPPTAVHSSLITLLLLPLLPPAMTLPELPFHRAADGGPVVPVTNLVKFLERLQLAALTSFGKLDFDLKYYVDLSLKHDLNSTERAFDALRRSPNGSVPVEELKTFIREYFGSAGNDMVYLEPADFVPLPKGFLPKVENAEVRAWALDIHRLWKNLSRTASDDLLNRPDDHTLLPLPKPCVIPGSRFRETYYWDSYWIIRGLLASKMHDTAKGIVINLISMIEKFGHVLNGARVYYTNRSQPPLLSSMVYDIYLRTQDLEFVRTALPALIKEHKFWNSGFHSITVQNAPTGNHSLCRYFAMWNEPRPESSLLDEKLASKLVNNHEKEHLYREIASAAESGWDFSTRWMRDPTDLSTLATTSILPVDLNVFILKMELDISNLARAVGDSGTAEQFLEASSVRKRTIDSIFWNSEKGQWLDYWLDNSSYEGAHTWDARNQNQVIYASNFIPLWIESFYSDSIRLKKVMKSLQNSGLLCDSGIATSMINSGQQWDFPNGWAPIQHMIVEGLVRSGSKEARALAEDIAVKWLRTNYVVYKKTGYMHEKYDVEKCGDFGTGGEYISQTGFGWSNGVVLAFLEEFGWPADQNID
ncbi:probable trehalase [Momordica charantia]|uniref:Trehalase n=1 Tax=Momordica charantia TaxID=3673 RepID=A0A6J1CVU6_MOMCH|nr:probable trehalase [Momordica charantia]